MFRDKLLVRAGPVSVPGKMSKLNIVERCREVVGLIYQWYWDNNPNTDVLGKPWYEHQVGQIVVEYPQIYAPGQSKGDPNDLPPMVGIDVGLACLFPRVPVQSYFPREWAGATTKAKSGDAWLSPRGQRVRQRLSASELAVLADVRVTHDVIDAIGIGLHHVGRFAPRRWTD